MEFLVILLGHVISFIFLVITTKLLTNVLTVEQFGILSTILLICGLISQLSFGFVFSCISRYLLDDEVLIRQVKQKMFWISLFLLICSLVLFLLLKENIVLFACFFLIFQGYNLLLNGINNAKRKRLRVSISNIVENLTKLIFLFFIINLFDNKVDENIVLFTFAFSLLITFLINKFILDKNKENIFILFKDDQDIRLKKTKKIVNYSLPITINNIFYWVSSNGDKFLISRLKSNYMVGQYMILYQYSFTIITMAFDVVMSYITPIVYEKKKTNNEYEYMRKCIIIVFTFGMILSLLFFFFKDLMIITVANKEYLEYSFLLPLISISAVFYCITQLFTLLLQAHEETINVAKIKTTFSIISLLLNIPAIYFGGVIGAVVILLSVNLIQLIYIYKHVENYYICNITSN